MTERQLSINHPEIYTKLTCVPTPPFFVLRDGAVPSSLLRRQSLLRRHALDTRQLSITTFNRHPLRIGQQSPRVLGPRLQLNAITRPYPLFQNMLEGTTPARP